MSTYNICFRAENICLIPPLICSYDMYIQRKTHETNSSSGRSIDSDQTVWLGCLNE